MICIDQYRSESRLGNLINSVLGSTRLRCCLIANTGVIREVTGGGEPGGTPSPPHVSRPGYKPYSRINHLLRTHAAQALSNFCGQLRPNRRISLLAHYHWNRCPYFKVSLYLLFWWRPKYFWFTPFYLKFKKFTFAFTFSLKIPCRPSTCCRSEAFPTVPEVWCQEGSIRW